MRDVEKSSDPSFADKLNILFDTAYPVGRGPYSSAEVVAGLSSSRYRLSAPYISQLRNGNRTAPSRPAMFALAGFFQVPVDYFIDNGVFSRIKSELDYRARYRESSKPTAAA